MRRCAQCLYILITSEDSGGRESLAPLFWGSWAEKFGNPWPSALREGVIIKDNELRQKKMYLFIVYHVTLPCLLQNETEQNVLFVDAFTLNCFLTDFHGG